MQGNKKVIAQLNEALSSELTAIVQYMAQSEMCQNWGYTRLGGTHEGTGDRGDAARGRAD
jgi:bacterioferritin (cytochrome b1)